MILLQGRSLCLSMRMSLISGRAMSRLLSIYFAAKNGLTFGDLFTIKRGLATGANDFFILPRKRAREIGIRSKFLKPHRLRRVPGILEMTRSRVIN
jgi:hypothetical protein